MQSLPESGQPTISFAIASYNAIAFLEAAVGSALAQRGIVVEVIIADDCSSDGSWELALRLAAADPRVRSIRTDVNVGPAGARNLALDSARGAWFAVLDADDLLHPDRSRRLLGEAERSVADMVADDLLLFDDDLRGPARLFLERARAGVASWIALPDYFDQTALYGRHPNLGFLKPMIRTDFIRKHAIRYDESLRIAEDDDLIVQLLRAGARYRLLPQPLYFYRKHGSSISHRLSVDNVDRMMAAGERLAASMALEGKAQSSRLAPRQRALRRAWAFTHLIDALKARRFLQAGAIALRHPMMLPLLRMPIGGAFRKIVGRPAVSIEPVAPSSSAVPFISRQRIMGATNGSSAYLLKIAEAVRAAGLTPHLIQPSPSLFGRIPFFRLRPEMAVFESHHVRGALRLGDWLIATDPAIFLAAIRGICARILRRVGFRGRFAMDRPAAYAISAPWTRDDYRFVANQASLRPRLAIADYMFQAEALPFLLNPGMGTATVMHDLFHARADQFTGSADSVTAIDAMAETRLLSQADAVLAIQATETEFVRQHVPGTLSILAPMPAHPVSNPQPGDADRLLFVGSNTAPNVLGLGWFLEMVWPEVQARRPASVLSVVGTVGAALGSIPKGVRILGLVDDLAEHYAVAGIVISPLHQGSGLKVKLIEALAHGKACVVTGVSLQGVEALLANAVIKADDAPDFIAAISHLQDDDEGRFALATTALAAARGHFSPEACFADFTAWLLRAAAD